MINHDIFILDGMRTAIGSTHKGLKDFTAPQLASFVIKGILKRNRLNQEFIDEVIIGNTVSAGTGQNLARQAGVMAGLPVTVPAFTVNSVCGSGLQALIVGTQAIKSKDAQAVIIGGTESSSQSPYLVKQKDMGENEKKYFESLIFDGLTCQITNKHMGNLIEDLVGKYGITRELQDRFALESHHKACRAIDQQKFMNEIVPVETGGGVWFKEDQRPRRNIELEKLSHLPPAFKEHGTVTAGNSSVPSDGAAIIFLVSQVLAKKEKLLPKARVLSYASVAVEPSLVFTSAIPAIKACLKKSQLSLKDIDLFEISEAFAAQAILTQQALKIPQEKINIFGGDIALGHPLGAAGSRILVTLLHALMDQRKKRGLAAVCLGGGGAVAIAIEIL